MDRIAVHVCGWVIDGHSAVFVVFADDACHALLWCFVGSSTFFVAVQLLLLFLLLLDWVSSHTHGRRLLSYGKERHHRLDLLETRHARLRLAKDASQSWRMGEDHGQHQLHLDVVETGHHSRLPQNFFAESTTLDFTVELEAVDVASS